MSKRILVIGATSKIGEAMARLFAAEKASFLLVARDEKKLQSVKNDLTARGAKKVETLILDLLDFAKHKCILPAAIKELQSIDIVLVSHGLLGDHKQCQDSFAQAETVLKTNFLSTVSILTDIANYFEKKRAGTIAVISSIAGDRGRRSNYIYGASKGGLSIFLEGLWHRLVTKRVHVVNIKPGFVDTPMTANFKKGPLFSTPESVAKKAYKAIKDKKPVVYTPFFWFPIMTIIRLIPNIIFKRLNL